MTLLKTAIKKSLLQICARIDGCSISEKNRTFSIRKAQSDTVIGLDLRNITKPAGESTCDGIFIVKRHNSKELSLVFVELKADNSKHALQQLKNTIKQFCNKPDSLFEHHKVAVGEYARLKRQGVKHSSADILAISICNKGINLEQTERTRLKMQKIQVSFKTTNQYSLTSEEVYKATMREIPLPN
jgi:hypothetical protein